MSGIKVPVVSPKSEVFHGQLYGKNDYINLANTKFNQNRVSFINTTDSVIYVQDFFSAPSWRAIPPSALTKDEIPNLTEKGLYLVTETYSQRMSSTGCVNDSGNAIYCLEEKRRVVLLSKSSACDETGMVRINLPMPMIISFKPMSSEDDNVFQDMIESVTTVVPQAPNQEIESATPYLLIDNVRPNSSYYVNISNRSYKLNACTTPIDSHLGDGLYIYDDSGGYVRYDLADCLYNPKSIPTTPVVLFATSNLSVTLGTPENLRVAIELESTKAEEARKAEKDKLDAESRERARLAEEESARVKHQRDLTSSNYKAKAEGMSVTTKGIVLATTAVGVIGACVKLYATSGFYGSAATICSAGGAIVNGFVGVCGAIKTGASYVGSKVIDGVGCVGGWIGGLFD